MYGSMYGNIWDNAADINTSMDGEVDRIAKVKYEGRWRGFAHEALNKFVKCSVLSRQT